MWFYGKHLLFIIWETVTKHMYSIYIYKSLLINVSISLIVSGVLPHMTSPPQREDRKLDLENIDGSDSLVVWRKNRILSRGTNPGPLN